MTQIVSQFFGLSSNRYIAFGATPARQWQTDASATEISLAGLAPSNPLESAIRVTLNPGAYTVIVTGATGGTGVGIVEVFAQ